MSDCSFEKEYKFDVVGEEEVPRHQYSYAGETLYKRLGENNYSRVDLPRDLWVHVPDKVRYEDKCYVTLKVDGTPYDRSVDRCSNTVDSLKDKIDDLTDNVSDKLNGGVHKLTGGVCELTGTTVAAATGITGAKVAAAETIAKSLSKGFSKYIGYLIREKLTELKAQLPNTASTFKALSNNLDKRKSVLGRDYERISERYSKLFVKLNDELRGRLLELDRPAFENCAQMQATIFTNPFGYILGQSVCAGAEQLQTADAVRVSRLKGTAATAMEVVKGYVKVIKRLSASVSGVLADRKISKTHTLSMPVVRIESDDIVTQDKGCVRTFVPQWFTETQDMSFGNVVSDAFAAKTTVQKSQTELEIVDSCFQKRFSNWAATTKEGGVDPRITEKILALWEKSKAEMYN